MATSAFANLKGGVGKVSHLRNRPRRGAPGLVIGAPIPRSASRLSSPRSRPKQTAPVSLADVLDRRADRASRAP